MWNINLLQRAARGKVYNCCRADQNVERGFIDRFSLRNKMQWRIGVRTGMCSQNNFSSLPTLNTMPAENTNFHHWMPRCREGHHSFFDGPCEINDFHSLTFS